MTLLLTLYLFCLDSPQGREYILFFHRRNAHECINMLLAGVQCLHYSFTCTNRPFHSLSKGDCRQWVLPLWSNIPYLRLQDLFLHSSPETANSIWLRQAPGELESQLRTGTPNHQALEIKPGLGEMTRISSQEISPSFVKSFSIREPR